MKHTRPPAAAARRPVPPPGPHQDPFEVERLARSVWLQEGAQPGREQRCREEVDCQLWLTRYWSPADRSTP